MVKLEQMLRHTMSYQQMRRRTGNGAMLQFTSESDCADPLVLEECPAAPVIGTTTAIEGMVATIPATPDEDDHNMAANDESSDVASIPKFQFSSFLVWPSKWQDQYSGKGFKGKN
jgi:hypothetical protein